jgi:hypothetical protein
MATLGVASSSQTQRNEELVITLADNKERIGMIQSKPNTVYVNPQQLQLQRERRNQTKKSAVMNPDPARVLAKAWRVGKLAI